MKNKLLYTVLGVIFVMDLILIAQESTHSLRIFTKPLLVPLIVIIYLVNTDKKRKIHVYFLTGLIFSFLGDVFLLFKWAFLPGLGSFLLAHILYIVSFVRIKATNSYGSLPFLLFYLICLLYFLHPHLHEMKVPVIIYGITISTMAYFSLCTKNKWIIVGAFLFIISDSLLSFNLFVYQATLTELLVMITYVAAQFFLVRGMTSGKRITQQTR